MINKSDKDKMKIEKPKSVILEEIEEFKEKKKNSKNIAEKIKYEAKILELGLQLNNQ